VTLIVGLATDLDQRILPDLLTLPVIPVALVYALSGANPLVGQELVPALLAAVAIPAVLYLPSIPFGAGAFGLGDVKLLIGVGLLAGGSRALGSVFIALLVAGPRPRRPAGRPPDRAPELHPVRAVLHRGGPLGGPAPQLRCSLDGPDPACSGSWSNRDLRVTPQVASHELALTSIMPPGKPVSS